MGQLRGEGWAAIGAGRGGGEERERVGLVSCVLQTVGMVGHVD